MDGNGRWALRHKKPRAAGHREGAESVRAVVTECARSGVKELTLYAFSTENWKRPQREVRFLMDLLSRFLDSELPTLQENDIRLKVVGRLSRLPASVLKKLESTVENTGGNRRMITRLALNYGGRQEILDAVARYAEAVEEGAESIEHPLTEERLRKYMYDSDMTDPDLLIRTGGETRLSNFLLWHLSYTELWFTPVCWPEFREAHLQEAFRAYAGRERRYGALRKGGSKRRMQQAGREAR